MAQPPKRTQADAAKAPRRGRPRNDGRAPISRDAIMAATWRVLSQSSVAGTSIKDVADSLGCHTASIFYHFPTKQALVVAVAVAAFSRELDWIHRIEAIGAPPDVTLFRVLHDDAYYVGAGAQHVRSIFLSPELRNAHSDELDQLMQTYENRLAALIKDGVKAGVFRVDNIACATDCLNALGMVGAVRWKDLAPGAARQLALTAARIGVGGLLVDAKRLAKVEVQAMSLKVQRAKIAI